MVVSGAVGEVYLSISIKKCPDGGAEFVVTGSYRDHPFSCGISRVPAGELEWTEAHLGDATAFLSSPIKDNVSYCFLALERLASSLSEYRPSCH